MSIFKAFYLSRRFFIAVGMLVIVFVISFFFSLLLLPAKILLLSLLVLTLADIFFLFVKPGLIGYRVTPARLSNGDDNLIEIKINNKYHFSIHVEIIDEVPFQFQKRDFRINAKIRGLSRKKFSYSLRPVSRGEYQFGALNVFVSSLSRLSIRRYRFDEDLLVPVYPSIIQMKKYDLFAVTHRLTEAGIKQLRRPGFSMEFDQIKKYITGDDYRKINWKATARKKQLMVNQFRDEKSQNIYCIIDTGRAMKMPFEQMTLLDYAINTSLVLSNIALRRDDRAGLILFSKSIEAHLPARGKYTQIYKILELLYACKPQFQESSFEKLYLETSHKIKTRSLFVLFTNFETLSSMKRNLKLLSLIARKHLLVIIFFVNTELDDIINTSAISIDSVYTKTIAKQLLFEKRQIIVELKQKGILPIITRPEDVTVNSINKYIELKMRGIV